MSLNRYSYVRNDPTALTDPSGLAAVLPAAAVPSASGPSSATLQWRYQTSNQVESSPAIGADGTV